MPKLSYYSMPNASNITLDWETIWNKYSMIMVINVFITNRMLMCPYLKWPISWHMIAIISSWLHCLSSVSNSTIFLLPNIPVKNAFEWALLVLPSIFITSLIGNSFSLAKSSILPHNSLYSSSLLSLVNL